MLRYTSTLLLIFIFCSAHSQVPKFNGLLLKDSLGTLSIQEILGDSIQAKFEKIDDAEIGIDSSFFWLKTHISNKEDKSQKYVVELANAVMDEVRAYEILHNKVMQVFAKQSYATPLESRIYPHHNFVYPITVEAGGERDIYLRIKRKILKVSAPLSVYKEADFIKKDRGLLSHHMIFAGFVLAIAILALILFVINKEYTYGYYSLYQLCLVMAVLLAEGFGMGMIQKLDFFFSIPIWRNVFVNLSIFWIFFFIRSFLWKGHYYDKHLNFLFKAGIFCLSVVFSFYFLEKQVTKFHIVYPSFINLVPHIFYFSALLLSILLALGSQFKGYNKFAGKIFLIGILPLFIFSILSAFRNIGFIPNYFWLSYKTRLLCIAFDASVVFAGIAIQFRKLRQENEERVREAYESKIKLLEEKERISRDLHDHVGSQLTVVSSTIDRAIYMAKNQMVNEDFLDKISANVREAGQSLRDTIWASQAEELSLNQLFFRIKNYAERVLPEGLILQTKADPSEHLLNAKQALEIFRIVQEALQNILKHANADLVKIKLGFQNNVLELLIEDNGKGFITSDQDSENGFGLMNMKKRAKLINGEINIESEPQKGTKISLVVPI
jgi:two-component system, sensor histidine kinase LadS